MTTKLSFGNKCSDFFAKKFASWMFVIPFLSVVGAWAFLNGIGYWTIDKDLAFVNFGISFITLFIDLVIIMNQIRQTNMDRDKLTAILSLERSIIKHIEAQSRADNRLSKKIDELQEAVNGIIRTNS